jgi:hypothetical protein
MRLEKRERYSREDFTTLTLLCLFTTRFYSIPFRGGCQESRERPAATQGVGLKSLTASGLSRMTNE